MFKHVGGEEKKGRDRGTAEVWIGAVFAVVFFVFFYMFITYYGFLTVDKVESALNQTGFGSSQFYSLYRSNLQSFIDFLNLMPLLAFFSIVLIVAYWHFIKVVRGKKR